MARTKPNQYLHDVAVQYQVYLERVKAGEMQKYDETLVELDRALRKIIARTGDGRLSDLSQAQLEKLIASALKETNKNANGFLAKLTNDLKAINAYAADFEYGSLTTGLVEKVARRIGETTAAKAWIAAKENPIQATGELLETFTENWRLSTLNKVEGVIRTGYAQGQTTGQLITKIRGTRANRYMDGVITGQNRRQTQAMIRTAIQHVSAQGRAAVWAENSDIIDGYIWVSVLDNRTTAVCRSLDGRFFKIGNGPLPPIHINCRSVTVAHIKGVDVFAFTTRASKGAKPGQVPASLTFYEWLKTQPAWFQDDAIGPMRGKLLRDGGLSAEKFAMLSLDKNFQPLTLEQMKEKAPAAFRRAGLLQ
jgi:SPP1 gp7 family putative phage head morphogenesis protein